MTSFFKKKKQDNTIKTALAIIQKKKRNKRKVEIKEGGKVKHLWNLDEGMTAKDASFLMTPI